jgi:hypothetical protein
MLRKIGECRVTISNYCRKNHETPSTKSLVEFQLRARILIVASCSLPTKYEGKAERAQHRYLERKDNLETL